MLLKNIIVFAFLFIIIGCLFPEETGLKVYTIDPVSLTAVRNEILKGNRSYDTALTRLKAEADKCVKQKIHTVIEKKQIPPGGDIHDYLSLSVYYWPDPSKKDGLPYILKDGQTNPEINSISDKAFFENMISSVFTLSLAYYFTKNGSYSAKTAEYLNAWFCDQSTMMNPNLEFAQIIKGKKGGNHSGIIDARDIIKVIDAVGLVSESKDLDEPLKENIKSWFGKYYIWLLESPNGNRECSSKNNHLTYYYSQVISISYFLGKSDMVTTYAGLLEKDLVDSQIEPDGSQPLELKRTKAISYSVFNLIPLFTLADQVKPLNIDLLNYESTDGRSVKKALDYIIPFATGEKQTGYKQIVKFETRDIIPLLIKAGHAYGQASYLDLARKLAGEKFESMRENLFFKRRICDTISFMEITKTKKEYL
jgi:hypothetical protein